MLQWLRSGATKDAFVALNVTNDAFIALTPQWTLGYRRSAAPSAPASDKYRRQFDQSRAILSIAGLADFLKEFLEEFLGLEEIIRVAMMPRADMDWIFRLPGAAELISEVEAGCVDLVCTGAGVDISDGSLSLALLARFTSTEYFRILRAATVGSWESMAAAPGRPAIEFRPIDGPELERLGVIESMEPSSIFSLDLARRYLSGR